MSDPYGPLGPSDPGYQQPPTSGPYGTLGPSVPGQTGAGTPVLIPPGAQFNLHLEFQKPLLVPIGPFLALVPLPVGVTLGNPQQQGNTVNVPVGVSSGSGVDPADVLNWIKALIAAMLAALIGLAAFNFTFSGGPQAVGQTAANLGKVAANVTNQAAQASGVPVASTGGIPWALIIAGGAVLFLISRR